MLERVRSLASKLFSTSSLTERIGILFVVSNVSALLLAFFGFFLVLIAFSLNSFVQELRSITLVIASTSRAAIAFEDRTTAERLLSALKEKDAIAWGALFDQSGALFAQYGKPEVIQFNTSNENVSWTIDQLRVQEPVLLDGERVGSLMVSANLLVVYQQIALMLGVLALVALPVAFTTVSFFKMLRQRVAIPIQNLRLLAQTVSVTKDFSQRLKTANDDEVNQLIQAFNHMLSQLEERDRSLIKAKERAESADRAKSMFLASISHEFRTPLHAVLGMTSEVLATRLDAEQRELLNTAKSSAESLLALINDILDFSKIEAGKLVLSPTRVNLRSWLTEVTKMFTYLCSATQLSLTSTVAKNVPDFVMVDSSRLTQIMVNLLGNACKFTPSGGSISVTVDSMVDPEKKEVNHLKIVVTDTGIGIPADKLEKVFESFTQLHRDHNNIQGTGLGLAIVSRLVNVMGGTIEVSSEEGVGTSFTFSIVALSSVNHVENGSQSYPIVSSTTPAPVIQFPPKAHRVLVVEDNAVNRKLLVRILERSGLVVEEAINGQECLRILAQQEFQAILMDVNMPVMDGKEAARRIRKQEEGSGRHVFIFAVTANVIPEDVAACHEAGMDFVLKKPLSREVLLQKLAECFGTAVEQIPNHS